MSFASPSRSSPTLDRYLRHGSGSKGSHSRTYSEVPTKPKKFQSAHYDETTGTWRCKNCGYTYPNPEPHHHQRRAHKKICPGVFSKVHRWLSVSPGEETQDSQYSSSVVDKPTTPDTSDSVTSKRALGEQDKGAGFQAPQRLDRIFQSHETPSSSSLPRESDIQELGDPKGMLSDQHRLVAAGVNSEARGKEELDSEPITDKGLKPGSGHLGRLLTLDSDFSNPREISQGSGRLLTLDSDFSLPREISTGSGRLLTLDSDSSLPREPSQERRDQVGFSAVGSSDFVPVSGGSANGSKEGRYIDMEELLPRSSKNEASSLKAGEDVLTTDDALKKRTEVAQGDQSTPSSSDENAVKDQATDELGGRFDQSEPRLNAADDGTRENTADVLQQVEESQTIATEDGNAEESREDMDKEFGETKAILPAAADDGAVGEKEEKNGSEQGRIVVAGDGTEYKSRDEDESSQFATRVGDEEALHHETSTDQSGQMVNATGEAGRLDGHDEIKEVGAISLEPLSDDAGGVTETPSNTGITGTKLSSAERNWDYWQHVVRGDDTHGKDEVQSVPQKIDDAGPPFSEDGMTASQSDDLEDDTADKNAPTWESKGGSVLTSDRDVGHQIGFQPAGLEWTLAFPDTINDVSDKQQPMDSREGSTSAHHHSSPEQDGHELIPGLDQEADQASKVALTLSAAEANWDDWEDVIKGGPMLMDVITLRKSQDPESSGEYQTSRVDSLGEVSGLGQGETGTVLESKSFVEGGVIDTAAATSLPVHVPDSENSDWLIDFSEPSVEENNSGTANEEAIPAISTSSPKLEGSGTNFLDLLDLNEGSAHEQGTRLLDSTPVSPQSETGQSRTVLSKLSSALRNWEDWDDVVRESERMSRPEKTSPEHVSDLADGDHQHGLESPSPADSNNVDTGSSNQTGSSEHSKITPPVADKSNRAAMNSAQEIDGLSGGDPTDGMVASVREEDEPPFRFPEAELEPKLSSNSLPKNLNLLDSGQGPSEGRKGVDDNEDTSRHEPGQAGVDDLSEDDWEVVQKNDYPPAGNRHSSPSFEDAQDGEFSSDREYPTGLQTAVNLPLGKRRWADWEDLTKSEYMVLDGPDGESLVFKRTSDARDESSAKALGERRETSPSFEEPDPDGGSPSLRRRRRQAPSFGDDRSPPFRSLKGASPRGVAKSDYSAGSNSFQGFETTSRSLPASSPRKSESGDLAPLVTRRPLIYRGSRRDYASEIEDQDVTNESPLSQHFHHHNQHEHEDALKYDVERVLRGQTTYELICPICGALITRKIIIRKKKRRFSSEEDPRWRRGTPEITPVADDGNRSPRSDVSSETEDLSGAWKQGVRPCFDYFFSS